MARRSAVAWGYDPSHDHKEVVGDDDDDDDDDGDDENPFGFCSKRNEQQAKHRKQKKHANETRKTKTKQSALFVFDSCCKVLVKNKTKLGFGV